MDERGKLVRDAGPAWLETFGEGLATAIGLDRSDLLTEGRDGTGPKTEVPWFRFASRTRSPSATTDWYCVYLFDTDGESMYLSLGHGSTVWNGVDFKPRPETELRALATWGRAQMADIAALRPELGSAIALKSRRSPLGPAYEAGTALALRYGREAVPSDETLVSDALFFAQLLGAVYRATDSKPLPVGPAPEVIEVLESADRAAGKHRPPRSGHGFRLNGKQRTAIERHAMAVAQAHLESQGWTVTDTSRGKPYDFYCTRDGAERYVEVKGTTSTGETLVLTRGEVAHHQAVWPRNALIVVAGIELGGPELDAATGGAAHELTPWSISEEALTVVSYIYRPPEHK